MAGSLGHLGSSFSGYPQSMLIESASHLISLLYVKMQWELTSLILCMEQQGQDVKNDCLMSKYHNTYYRKEVMIFFLIFHSRAQCARIMFYSLSCWSDNIIISDKNAGTYVVSMSETDGDITVVCRLWFTESMNVINCNCQTNLHVLQRDDEVRGYRNSDDELVARNRRR